MASWSNLTKERPLIQPKNLKMNPQQTFQYPILLRLYVPRQGFYANLQKFLETIHTSSFTNRNTSSISRTPSSTNWSSIRLTPYQLSSFFVLSSIWLALQFSPVSKGFCGEKLGTSWSFAENLLRVYMISFRNDVRKFVARYFTVARYPLDCKVGVLSVNGMLSLV